MDRYTNEDAAFDDERLNGPRCPKHGRAACSCCITCGYSKGHAPWCRDREEDDEPILQAMETGS